MSTRFNINEIKETSDFVIFHYKDTEVYNHGRPKDWREQNKNKIR